MEKISEIQYYKNTSDSEGDDFSSRESSFEEESNEYSEESLENEMEEEAFEWKPYTRQNTLDSSTPKFNNNPVLIQA